AVYPLLGVFVVGQRVAYFSDAVAHSAFIGAAIAGLLGWQLGDALLATAPLFALLGFVLMLGWLGVAGLEGKLGGGTGRASASGRLLDGVADHLVFVAVYAALAFSFQPPWAMVALAFAAGGAHAVQAAFYEAKRETFIRRSAGQFVARTRSRAGGPFEAFYNSAERVLGNRTTTLDHLLAGLPA
ncbi:MAG: metal ABC transporter permease, partial [Thermaurantiacus sp.]